MFELGCRQLINEPDRRRAGAGGRGTDELMVIAGRLAAASCLGAVVSFRAGSGDGPDGPIDGGTVQLTGGVEPVRRDIGPTDEVSVSVGLIRDVLGKALFSSRGPERMGWPIAPTVSTCARGIL